MKKIILTIAFVATGLMSFAQVGVGTSNPETSLHVVGANASGAGNTPGTLTAVDGITVPVVIDDMTDAGTVNGTKTSQLVYSTNANSTGYYYWNGTAWAALVPSTKRSIRVDATGNLTAADLNNIVIVTAINEYDLSTISSSAVAGDSIVFAAYSNFSFAAADRATSSLNGPLALGIGIEYIYNGTVWYSISGKS